MLTYSPDLSALLSARYGQEISTTDFPALNNAVTVLLTHCSVRSYLPDPLPPGTLDLLIAAAQSAPTSSNSQAWSVVAVEDPARKARLAALCRDQKHIHEAPLFLVWLADLSRLRRVAATAGSTAEALDYVESFVIAVIDAALAAQNALVAAESLGLGTVYIGAIRNEPEKVALELALPPEVLPVFGLVVGFPDPSRPLAEVKPRLPAAAVLHREIYNPAAETKAITDYDAILSAFQTAQNLPATGWTTQASQRVLNAVIKGVNSRFLTKWGADDSAKRWHDQSEWSFPGRAIM